MKEDPNKNIFLLLILNEPSVFTMDIIDNTRYILLD